MNDRTTILKSEFFRNLANYMAAENSNLNEMRSITNQNSAYRRKPNSPEGFRPQKQSPTTSSVSVWVTQIFAQIFFCNLEHDRMSVLCTSFSIIMIGRGMKINI